MKFFFSSSLSAFFFVFVFFTISAICGTASADDPALAALVEEALKYNHDILMAESKIEAARARIPQAQSLPDPMFMIGYQNEGWEQYTYGKEQGAQWMFSASQMFPYPGKLKLRSEMASFDLEALLAEREGLKLRTAARVKELYFDLFFVYKGIDILDEKKALLQRIEDAALVRYASGMAGQQDVLMAQTEKYMVMERGNMLRQKLQSAEAMLNSVIGRDAMAPVLRPQGLPGGRVSRGLDELLKTLNENSPDLKVRQRMISSAESRVSMSEKEFYPDFTIGANYARRGGAFMDMWSLTTSFNIPIFYKTKQREALSEMMTMRKASRHELEAARVMLAASVRDNYSMLRTSEAQTDLYRNGLIPKASQDFEAALASYVTGRAEAMRVIGSLKSLIDAEFSYWEQSVEGKKAIVRLEALVAAPITEQGEKVR